MMGLVGEGVWWSLVREEEVGSCWGMVFILRSGLPGPSNDIRGKVHPALPGGVAWGSEGQAG